MIRFRRAIPVALAILAGLCGASDAQNASCDRMRADLASLERTAAAVRNPYADQLRRQRAEIDRQIAYARSIGCQRQRFLFFGDPPPAQCGGIEAQINRMEAGLAQLDAQAQRAGGGQIAAQRAAILAAYDSQCRAGGRQPNLFERLFGGAPSGGEIEVPPMPEDLPQQVDGPAGLAGSGKTLCVRKCDGFYFPISPNTSRARYETDAGLCQASCPNAEVELFVQPSGRDAKDAVSLSGEPYSSIPNAFRYRTAFDPTCSCRKPGQSWVEALGDAERLVGDRRTDIVVTEEKSLELSRPKDPAPARQPPGRQTARGKPQDRVPEPGAAERGAAEEAAQAASGAAAPTASQASSGIGGPQTTATTVPAGQGDTRQVTAPDGSRRTVRVVAPTLGPASSQ